MRYRGVDALITAIRKNHPMFPLIRILNLAAAGVLVATPPGLLTKPAHAVPPAKARGTVTTYYSDAQKTKKVGTFSNCPFPPPPRGSTGKQPPHHTSHTINFGGPAGAPPNTTPQGKLPCEFLAKGCWSQWLTLWLTLPSGPE